jgi:hypothetical protein
VSEPGRRSASTGNKEGGSEEARRDRSIALKDVDSTGRPLTMPADGRPREGQEGGERKRAATEGRRRSEEKTKR